MIKKTIHMQDDLGEVSNHLKPIIIHRKKFARADHIYYRVYTAPGEYTLVQADSAHEAFAQSGLSRVYKIERENFLRLISLDKEQVHAATGEAHFSPELPEFSDGSLYDDSMEELAELLKAPKPFEEISIRDLERRLKLAMGEEDAADEAVHEEPQALLEPEQHEPEQPEAQALAPQEEEMEMPDFEGLTEEQVQALLDAAAAKSSTDES